jgi:hypothetical protein
MCISTFPWDTLPHFSVFHEKKEKELSAEQNMLLVCSVVLWMCLQLTGSYRIRVFVHQLRQGGTRYRRAIFRQNSFISTDRLALGWRKKGYAFVNRVKIPILNPLSVPSFTFGHLTLKLNFSHIHGSYRKLEIIFLQWDKEPWTQCTVPRLSVQETRVSVQENCS